MHHAKAPGIDGYSALFYPKFWQVIKGEVCGEILNFMNNGILDYKVDETQIVLLSNVKEPTKVTEFRPISLCNI